MNALDLSGTLQGAGGVGGLLCTFDYATSTKLLPLYDGLGNLHGMVHEGSGAIVAAFEYDAFGTTLRESGAYADDVPFRFATKYADIETGLIYHDTRYYSPSLGRFITRDSIGEQGGLNLYAYVSNRVPNAWDYLGMDARVNVVGGYNAAGEYVAYAEQDDGPTGTEIEQAKIAAAGNVAWGSAPAFNDMSEQIAYENAVWKWENMSTGEREAALRSLERAAQRQANTREARAKQSASSATTPGTVNSQPSAAPNSGIGLRTPQQRAMDESYAREVAMGRGAKGQLAFGDMSSDVVRLDPFVVTASRVADVALFVGGVFFEPLDWAATAREIYNEPRNPWSYAGLLPIVPAGVGKLGKIADRLHDLPGSGPDWIKLKGSQGWKDADGNFWKKDQLHKDHWDVSDRNGNKVREVDFGGRQIWPGGPKNKNK